MPSSPRRCWCRPRAFIGDQMKIVDPDAIHRRARGAARASSAATLEPQWRAAYASTARQPLRICRPRPRARGGCARWRSAILMASGAADAPTLALKQFDEADNMTDRQGALGILANSEAPERRDRARRLLRPLQGRCAGASTNGSWSQALSTPRRHAEGGAAAARPSRFHAWSIRTGCARCSARSARTSARSTTGAARAIASSPT